MYFTCTQIIGTSTRSTIQHVVEIKIVAEQLHFKISTLLLHGGKIIEAISWFRQHIAWYKRFIGSPEAVFLHWEWMSRQYLVFAELLETSSAAIPSISSVIVGTAERHLTEWEYHPAYYYQVSSLFNLLGIIKLHVIWGKMGINLCIVLYFYDSFLDPTLV